MSKMFVIVAILGVFVFIGIAVIVLWPMPQPRDLMPSVGVESSVTQLPTAVMAPALFVEATPSPLTPEEIQTRFERLSEREQRLGIPVERGTPIAIDLDAVPQTVAWTPTPVARPNNVSQ